MQVCGAITWRKRLDWIVLWPTSAPPAYRAPSIDGLVDFHSTSGRNEHVLLQVLDSSIDLTFEVLPFGPVSAGTLTVNATIIDADWTLTGDSDKPVLPETLISMSTRGGVFGGIQDVFPDSIEHLHSLPRKAFAMPISYTAYEKGGSTI